MRKWSENSCRGGARYSKFFVLKVTHNLFWEGRARLDSLLFHFSYHVTGLVPAVWSSQGLLIKLAGSFYELRGGDSYIGGCKNLLFLSRIGLDVPVQKQWQEKLWSLSAIAFLAVWLRGYCLVPVFNKLLLESCIFFNADECNCILLHEMFNLFAGLRCLRQLLRKVLLEAPKVSSATA